jgi:hypothetical protein
MLGWEACVMKAGLLLLLLAAPATSAQASEIFGGGFAHDVDTPLTFGGFEEGADLQLGFRGSPITGLRAIGSPSPYLFGSLSTAGDTNFIAMGLSWRIGGRVYVRPGLGIALHDRDSLIVGPDGLRRDLGSRVLFEPEIGAGYQVNGRVSIEASWVHVSQGQLFDRQNPGMDSLGIRLHYKLR